jgi:predicted GNAT family N-acyltransferase
MKISAFIKTQEGKTFVCREPFNDTELQALFQLRYQVYRASSNEFLFPQNPYKMDIDADDLRAYHFGVFECEGNRQNAVGCMRLITEAETRFAPMIRHIIAPHGELCALIEQNKQSLLPIFKFLDHQDAQSMMQSLKQNYSEVSETGRFCLHESLQRSGIARFAVNSMVSASLDYLSDTGVVLIIVSEMHGQMYSRFGFEPFAQVLKSDTVPENFVMLKISMEQVRERLMREETTRLNLPKTARFADAPIVKPNAG